MEDEQIIALYFARDESAVSESARKYGKYCENVAQNILHVQQDAEECVNDTWLRAWESIPPQRPGKLKLFLAKITRNLALDRWRSRHAQRSGGGQTPLCLEELTEVIGEDAPRPEQDSLRDVLERFLRTLPEEQRRIFMMRYWYLLPIREIAARTDRTEQAVRAGLSRIRKKLRAELMEEGIRV